MMMSFITTFAQRLRALPSTPHRQALATHLQQTCKACPPCACRCNTQKAGAAFTSEALSGTKVPQNHTVRLRGLKALPPSIHVTHREVPSRDEFRRLVSQHKGETTKHTPPTPQGWWSSLAKLLTSKPPLRTPQTVVISIRDKVNDALVGYGIASHYGTHTHVGTLLVDARYQQMLHQQYPQSASLTQVLQRAMQQKLDKH
jgi:hypothetical protein